MCVGDSRHSLLMIVKLPETIMLRCCSKYDFVFSNENGQIKCIGTHLSKTHSYIMMDSKKDYRCHFIEIGGYELPNITRNSVRTIR